MSLYTGKLCLAPMVRSGELPTRLMALKYGADLVWSPEIIDKKLLKCERVVNENLGTVDFVEVGGNYKIPGVSNLVFRTLPKVESGKLIFQIGTANPELAVSAAKIVAKDVDGIDVNAGCPKPFSTHSGMGAALLSTPDLLESILKNLVSQGKIFNIPISVKIRLLDDKDPQPTVELVDRLCKTGITNLTLHCRTKDMRNRQSPVRAFLPEIIRTCHSNNVSFIINGAITNRREYEELQSQYGADIGCMIAEGAESNPTCFSLQPLTWNKVVKEFIETAESVSNYAGNTKYVILNQIPGKSPFYQRFARGKTNQELLSIANEIGESGNKIVTKVLQKIELIETKKELPKQNGKRKLEEEDEAQKEKENVILTKRKLEHKVELNAEKVHQVASPL
ncbi:tRNA-dihydrouridine(20) synthase [NAD(P)+] [[Candida] railenensis]|uniref:tRNA-dihydrouridine(20) synthase [NAD(P)+] n=1 Tax=[Candida] railenensis TaxID=45579 RepID=A0A9P0VW97_9ASCO|nr:tRNA-dihydrouridine(20) synthase [NAD(P)+] [[Candida] railenensis]